MAQAELDLTRYRSLTQVLHHTGRLPEAAIAHILAQLLGHLTDNSRKTNACRAASGSGGLVRAPSVWLAVGKVTVEILALPNDRSTLNVGADDAKPADSPARLRGGSIPSADDAWAVGSLAVECALATEMGDAQTALLQLRESTEFTPAFLDVVDVCLRTTTRVRPTVADLRKHDFFVQHSGAGLWLRTDGRVQLQLSEEIVVAGTRYLYSELRAGNNAAVRSFLTDQSVVVEGSSVTSGSVVAAQSAVKNQSLDGCVARAIAAEPASYGATVPTADGAQASWITTASGVALDGSVFSHRLTLGIADNSIDELVVERWDMLLPAPSAGKEATARTAPTSDPAAKVATAAHFSSSVKLPINAWCGSESHNHTAMIIRFTATKHADLHVTIDF